MHSTITSQGETLIPAPIRERLLDKRGPRE